MLQSRRVQRYGHDLCIWAVGLLRACPMAPGPGPGPGPGPEPPVAPIGHALVFPGRGPGPVAPLDTPERTWEIEATSVMLLSSHIPSDK
jgi:hypothetical protein